MGYGYRLTSNIWGENETPAAMGYGYRLTHPTGLRGCRETALLFPLGRNYTVGQHPAARDQPQWGDTFVARLD